MPEVEEVLKYPASYGVLVLVQDKHRWIPKKKEKKRKQIKTNRTNKTEGERQKEKEKGKQHQADVGISITNVAGGKKEVKRKTGTPCSKEKRTFRHKRRERVRSR